jgi:hypothetical protein
VNRPLRVTLLGVALFTGVVLVTLWVTPDFSVRSRLVVLVPALLVSAAILVTTGWFRFFASALLAGWILLVAWSTSPRSWDW